ncbi:SgcJ/EcaC family oxidoreductase [Pseudomonas sp. CDFA 602]|uniref:SgcJ/EcaC family oxidoreductase n=1 Tax=Pseudomonas californiensis TaxID=2829823 RepID=UPI001E45D4BF|nr:SgcJ/EcaC family oxidoreductase [Pseudomonas californiensis]MCD5993147.1 SgcJ/EcaC family oxidoreductase [Pseudomonas californiensis]MCD5998524.1 SgcJ/EcaC family oxidoreductase [Pseudomonas californiensis]
MNMKLTALALMFAVSAPMVAQAAAEPSGYSYRMVADQPSNVNDKEIAGLFDRWNKALKTGNSDTVVSLYTTDAVLQPTVSNKVRATPAEIKDYFDHFLALKPVGEINYREIRRLGTDAAVDSGVYTFTLTAADGKKSTVQARYTFLYHRVGNEWKILNHHSSAMPEVQPQYQVSR